MEINKSEKYDKRLLEIDERVSKLREHMSMWGKAGGRGDGMAMQAFSEINKLLKEKERILNGSQIRIDEIQEKIDALNALKKQCHFINFIKKRKLSNEINFHENEKNSLLRR